MRTAVIGMGNMGSQYAAMIAEGKINGMELAAVTRIRPERMEMLRGVLPEDLPVYPSAEQLYTAVDREELALDAVLIVTPHDSHAALAKEAFRRGIHVLCDKPAGIYSRQAREMEEAYAEARKKKLDLQFGFIFHQRTFPVYQRLKMLVQSGKYGQLKRVNWVITDWYRPNAYYTKAAWRGTWKLDGGGVLLNQCPHNLDLLQWIAGMPSKVQGFCHEGKYHPIEVEDEVTAYLEWENGATGTFITSTGEAAGVNRLEISLDNALLVCENGKLRIGELDKPEVEYRAETENVFIQPKMIWSEESFPENDTPYEIVLQNFAEGQRIAEGGEARKSLLLSNAVYLSSWECDRINIPKPGSEAERKFEQRFEERLREKQYIGG